MNIITCRSCTITTSAPYTRYLNGLPLESMSPRANIGLLAVLSVLLFPCTVAPRGFPLYIPQHVRQKAIHIDKQSAAYLEESGDGGGSQLRDLHFSRIKAVTQQLYRHGGELD